MKTLNCQFISLCQKDFPLLGLRSLWLQLKKQNLKDEKNSPPTFDKFSFIFFRKFKGIEMENTKDG